MVNTENKTTVKFRGITYDGYTINTSGEVVGKKRNNVMAHTHLSSRDYVTLVVDGESSFVQVAEAVLESFYGVSDDKREKFIGFVDGDTYNNDISNLFWTSRRQWWLDDRLNVSENITNKIIGGSLMYPTLTLSELSKELNIPKGLIKLLTLDSLETDDTNHQSVDISEDLIQSSDVTIEDPFDGSIDKRFEEIFGDVISVSAEYNKILDEEIPALEYAGVSQKKIMKYVLYKYGKDVYEYFKEKHINNVNIKEDK